MTLQRQIGFWLISLVVAVLFLVVLRDVLLPFIAALALAYLLDPLADRLERLGMSRLAATILILVVFLLLWSGVAPGSSALAGRSSPRTPAIRSAISSARRRNGSVACCNRSGRAAPPSSVCSRCSC
jgi:hypothetical protein